MEERGFRAFWKKNYKIIFLFLIRIVEVFTSSIIPSIVAVGLLFLNPNQKIWNGGCMLALVAFAVINGLFLIKYAAGRGIRKEFYILNGVVYAIYAVSSVFAYKFCGYLVYSMIFANLRAFEAFHIGEEHIKTIYSILICNGLIVVNTIAFGIYAKRHMRIIRILARKNSADPIELESVKAVPMQKNKVVNMLSVEEMDKHIEEEIKEGIEAYKEYQKTLVVDESKIIKGNGEEINFVAPEDPENDIDETDYVEMNAEALNKNKDYDPESLWNKEIYKNGEPLVDYEDEIDEGIHHIPVKLNAWGHVCRFIKRSTKKFKYMKHEKAFKEYLPEEEPDKKIVNENEFDSELLWSEEFYKGNEKNKKIEKVEDFEESIDKRIDTGLDNFDEDNLWDFSSRIDKNQADTDENDSSAMNAFEDYDSDSLWSKDFVQGIKKDK